MRERNGPNAIFKGGKLSASLSVPLADPKSAKQRNAILMKERNGQPNAIFEGGNLSVSVSGSLADLQSAKHTSNSVCVGVLAFPCVIIINETKKWTTKCKIVTQKAERITSVSPVCKALINKRGKQMSTKRQIQRQNAKLFFTVTPFLLQKGYGRPAGRSPRAIYPDLGG